MGVKGSVALVGAELGGAIGINKSILNQQIDGRPIDWSDTLTEGAIEGAFGAWGGYGAGSSAMRSFSGGSLAPGSWYSSYQWSRLPADFATKLWRSLLKSGVKDLIMPPSVHSMMGQPASTPKYNSGGGGGGGAW